MALDKGWFQCDSCEEIFFSLVDVKDHINEIHKQKPPKIDIKPVLFPKDIPRNQEISTIVYNDILASLKATLVSENTTANKFFEIASPASTTGVNIFH